MILKRIVPWALGAYVLFMFGLTLSGVGRLTYYGDELIHLEKLQVFLEHGVYALSGGESASGELLRARGHIYSYGPIFTISAHLAAVLFGIETWGIVGYSDASFEIRHIMVGVFSFIGVLAAAWGVTLVTRSRVWGLATASVLVSIPMWTGSAMFNLKDTPLATGYTLFTAGCIALTLPGAMQDRFTRDAGWFAVFGGTLIFWGVRPGIWPAIALGFFAMALIFARFNNFSNWTRTITALIVPFSAVIASYLAMVFLYPHIFLNPITLLYRSFKDTAGFPHVTTVLTDGEVLSMPPPWYYIPKWFAAQLPEVLVLLAVVATFVAIWVVVKRLFRSTPTTAEFAFPALIFVFIQFAAFPAAAILLKSTIYGGLRQFVFIFPALAMLIMIALFLVTHTWNIRRFRGVWPTTIGLVAASTLLTSAIQVQMFPYITSYFNPTTVAGGIDGRWEVYAWKMAPGELYSALSKVERERCAKGCPGLKTFPSTFQVAAADQSTTLQYWEIVRFPDRLNVARFDDSCSSEVASVTRQYLASSVLIIKALACTVPAKTLEVTPVSVEDSRKWWKRVTQWGWALEQPDGITSLPGVSSALAWSVDSLTADDLPDYVVSLSVLPGSAELVTVSGTVNGVELDDVVIAAGAETDLVIQVPTPVMEGAPDNLVVVEFVLSDGNGSPVTNTLVVGAIKPYL